MDEESPIHQAIDRGGGQTCDILGVVRELAAAGYVIVPRNPTPAMKRACAKALSANPHPDGAVILWGAFLSAVEG